MSPPSKKRVVANNSASCIDDDDHYDRRQQRRRTDSAPAPVRLRRQLLSLADSPLRRWSEEVTSIARIVTENYDDENLRETFLNLSLQLVLEQPLKTPFVAAVVVVVNALKSELVDMVLARLATQIEKNVGKGQWREVKLLLKFLACLQGCLEGNGVFPLLEDLFTRAADLQTASSDDVGLPGLKPTREVTNDSDMLLILRQRLLEPRLSRLFSSPSRTRWLLPRVSTHNKRQISWRRQMSLPRNHMLFKPSSTRSTLKGKRKARQHQ